MRKNDSTDYWLTGAIVLILGLVVFALWADCNLWEIILIFLLTGLLIFVHQLLSHSLFKKKMQIEEEHRAEEFKRKLQWEKEMFALYQKKEGTEEKKK